MLLLIFYKLFLQRYLHFKKILSQTKKLIYFWEKYILKMSHSYFIKVLADVILIWNKFMYY